MNEQTIQLAVFCLVLGAIALITYIKCTGQNRHSTDSNKEYFLAGGGLTWVFVAGSITLTNLSTDQLVGMNGNQMMLLALWELAGFVGLMVLAKVFLPVYYRNNCTTTTELLEKRYNSKHIRALVSTMFLFINVFVFQPAVIYTGALFMISMTGIDAGPADCRHCLCGIGCGLFGTGWPQSRCRLRHLWRRLGAGHGSIDCGALADGD